MYDINTIKKRFFALNRDRLAKTRDTLRQRQREVMDLLPLLFHHNHPGFPGFVSRETPAGISEYSPTKRSLEACKNLMPSFDFKSRALARYDIHALFLMGSCGSMSFSSDSDFDIWLCHRPGIAGKPLEELQQKATAIEEWAASFNLEVHFFLMDAERFRAGENVELSSESSGSAQHYLLLDEFYRTGILFAGRYPVWWLVPPQREQDYDQHIRTLSEKRFIRDGEFIDFGAIPTAPVQEFFGAALWQLYKSIDSPYKAVLKLMLMEVYASEYPDTRMLCTIFKQMIYDGERDYINLDAYMILYRKIEHYLRHNGDGDSGRLNLVRQCFYFKSGQKLGTPPPAGRMSWQQEMMMQIVRSWGWTDGMLINLDARPRWKINRVIEERSNLVSALTQCYRFLSNFARHNVRLSDINQKDLNILGRKLYSAFERKAGKIELVNRGISDDIHETHLTFHQVGKNGSGSWMLFQGAVFSAQLAARKPLKRSRSLVELIAWCYLNKLLDARTSIAVFSKDNTLTSNDIQAIVRILMKAFPNGDPAPVSTADLLKPPHTVSTTVFVNVGNEPAAPLLANGMQMTSSKDDALCYSGISQNLVHAIDQLSQTSWQEVMSHHYEGEHGVLEFIAAMMQGCPPGSGNCPPAISVNCFTTGRGMSIAQRVSELYKDIIDCYYHSDQPDNVRYLLSIAKNHYVLYLEEGELKYHVFASLAKLLEYLGAPTPGFAPLVIDRHAINLHVLPTIYRMNRPDLVQFFYQQNNDAIDCYVLDEHGALFSQTISGVSERIVLNHFKRFLDTVVYRQNIQSTEIDTGRPEADRNSRGPEFYQLKRGRDGKLAVLARDLDQGHDAGGYFNLQVITDADEHHHQTFTIYFDDQEYSSLEFGDKVFEEVAKQVLLKRKSNSGYPIYITDLDLSGRVVGRKHGDYLQTRFYLQHKRDIEERFINAMLTLAQSLSARA